MLPASRLWEVLTLGQVYASRQQLPDWEGDKALGMRRQIWMNLGPGFR
jgi:hypothetical protein